MKCMDRKVSECEISLCCYNFFGAWLMIVQSWLDAQSSVTCKTLVVFSSHPSSAALVVCTHVKNASALLPEMEEETYCTFSGVSYCDWDLNLEENISYWGWGFCGVPNSPSGEYQDSSTLKQVTVISLLVFSGLLCVIILSADLTLNNLCTSYIINLNRVCHDEWTVFCLHMLMFCDRVIFTMGCEVMHK
jgi:hypothetical protein